MSQSVSLYLQSANGAGMIHTLLLISSGSRKRYLSKPGVLSSTSSSSIILVIINVGLSSPNPKSTIASPDVCLSHIDRDQVNDFLEDSFLKSGHTKIAPFSFYGQIWKASCSISLDRCIDNSSRARVALKVGCRNEEYGSEVVCLLR